jgi:ELWxxDGT repeat protein
MKKLLSVALFASFMCFIGNSQTIVKVKEINPNGNALPSNATIYKALNKLFFIADDGTKKGLWVSDGTDNGTQFVEEFSSASNFKEFNGKLFFRGYQNAQVGDELYVTDGTTAGTYLFKDIRPNGSSNPQNLHVFNGYLYFQANNGTDGEELWRTDGTPNNTFQWLEFQLGSNAGYPKNFFNYKGKMFFSARTQTLGTETLWASDGEVLGTDFFVDSAISPRAFFVMNDTLYFASNGDHIYKSDGTKQGTYRIKDIHPTKWNDSEYFTVLNNKFYFVAQDPDKDFEMFVSDGTPNGTKLFYEFDLNNTILHPRNLYAHNGRIYFAALHPSLGYELWSTDGTLAGTSLLKDINPTGGSHPQNFISVNNDLFFTASDGAKGGLWKTNGTTLGTIQYDVPFATNANYSVGSLTEYNGSLYFSANFDNSGVELYKLDLVSGISDKSFKTILNVYPNPASNFMEVVGSEEIESINITDVLGRKVIAKSNIKNSNTTIDVSALSESTYFIHIKTTSDNSAVKSFVKQ